MGRKSHHDYSELSRSCLPLPPLPEQRAIVRYLDHVDDRIRRYVSAKEKLIALLEEERQAVIHRAVTRGLDPNVPLKPSGVEWLATSPPIGRSQRSRRLCVQSGDGTPPTANLEYYGAGHTLDHNV